MGQIITICNPKGGTAKTSTAINLACAMRAVNKKVLLVDFDPQGSASCALGFMQTDIECNLATAILDNVNIENCIVPYLKGGFDVILSSDELVAVPPALNDDPNAHFCLYNLLCPLKDRYDLIIVDTPASLNLLTKSAICASDFIISTVSLDILSVDSMASLMNFYEKLKSNGMTGAIVLGLLRTMYEPLHKMCDVISQPLSAAELAELGSLVGSDVPFCTHCGTMLAEGRGERLRELPAVPDCWFVICKPVFSVSTAELYREIDNAQISARPDHSGMERALLSGDLLEVTKYVCNVFDPVVAKNHGEIHAIKSVCDACGAMAQQMTGSGSAVFAIARDAETANAIFTALKERYACVFIAKPV